MEAIEHIKWVVQAVAAAAAFVGAIAVLARPIRAITKTMTSIITRLDTLERHQRETWMETLRHKIFSSSLPLTERVNAGEIYISHGGNGTAKVQHDENVKQLRIDGLGASK